ncbi:ATP-dependent DNA helicase Q4 [Paramormyrops kingsleyae]|uniref:ATP-dependent DNA helicase Q4 n=1 Tax=Paramormyrops kingsleyae TaxID=1676925 RepID=A0A3B3Q9D6_9TELE|nr:ATP-dependent DNA helicase Q4 [Paramormyrops kingsleyae]
MDRYNDVKVLLKGWEQSFLRENQRKPNKDDIDSAPDETKRLYKEYRRLKEEREAAGHDPSLDRMRDQAPEKDSGSWGSHLNRKNKPMDTPKLTSKDRESLQTSAQYFGMKLKANLGDSIKERSVSLKKSFTPRREPVKSWKDGPYPSAAADAGAPSLGPPVLLPNPRAPSPVADEAPFETLPAFAPSGDCQPKAGTPNALAERAQRLRRSITERLSSVDSGWLKRCQVFDEVADEEKPATGNLCSTPRAGMTVSDGASENTPAASPQVAPVPRDDSTPPQEPVSRTVREPPPQRDKLQVGHVMSPAGKAQSEASLCGYPLKARVGEGDGESRRGPGGEACSGQNITPVSGAKDSRLRARNSGAGEVTMGDSSQGRGSEVRSEKEGVKMRRRKRQREPEGEADKREGVGEAEGTDIKRRRTRKGSAEGSSAPRAKRKKAKETEDENGDQDGPAGQEKVKQKLRMPQENLLGEVDEEDFRRGSSQLKKPVKTRTNKNTDGNFVKINLKKKSHVKGFALRGAALRKQMYMQKFQLKGEHFGGGAGRGRGRFTGFSRQGDSCFRCGGIGHWAQDCRGQAPAPTPCVEASQEVHDAEEPFELPTLEEVARATGTLRCELPATPGCKEETEDMNDNGGEVLLNVIRPDYERPQPPPPMEPFYDLGEDGKVRAVTAEVYEALADFGYKSFRPGQEVAIMRILSGLSTLVVLSTGMGKSLCYQLPAYLYAKRSKSIALVVSPLVSLMDDQLSGLPPKLKAACIHSNMSRKQREAAVEKVKAGQVHVLLLSPEALVGGGHSGSGCLPPASQLPPVAFACIDEAHCVSEWSHNFRPCYLRLCKVLRERLGVHCLLGLTATATLSTALDVAHHLEIADQEGIAVRSAAVPDNLQLSVSTDRDKDQALVSLLKGERFGSLESIIVYCTRREETTRIAALLRTCLQGVMLRESSQTVREGAEENPVEKRKRVLAAKKIRKPLKWIAESYHAGMSASERRRVQNNFMCGELRVVVATVAFGMGLDKSDVRGIVHYNMPKSFESYVQEIGRAGRDGAPAHCHLFLDPEGGDLHELRKHIHADTVDYFTVKRLVQKVFPACKCQQIHQKQQDLVKATEVDDMEMLELMETCDELEWQTAVTDEKMEPKHQSVVPEGQQEKVKSHEEETDKIEPMEATVQLDGEQSKEESLEAWRVNGQVEKTDTPRVCHTHERAIPIQETVEALDVTEEGLETLLCYLELHPQQWVELLHPTLSACQLMCYGGPQQLRKLTKICPPVAVVLARRRLAGERVEACNSLQFDVVELADTMGWQLPLVKRGLRQLQWGSDGGPYSTSRSGILVEFSSLSFYFRSYGDLTANEMDRVCEFLHRRVLTQERTQLYQLKACFRAFRSVAHRSCGPCTDEWNEERSLKLKALLKDYFDKKMDPDLIRKLEEAEEEDDDDDELNKCKMSDWEDQIRADIRGFLTSHSDEKFSGRAVARIFHGIGSPCFPAQTFGRDRRYWRKYIRFDFNEIIRLATQEIIGTK